MRSLARSTRGARGGRGPLGADFDVVAVGELNPDIVLAGISADGPIVGTEQEAGSFALTLGSSNAICLVGLQRLGAATALVARVGDDTFGRFCLEALGRDGVATEYVRVDPAVATGLTVSLTYPSDRLLATFLGAMAELGRDDVPAVALERAGHLHVGSIFLQRSLLPRLSELFADAAAKGLTISLDTGWDPSGRWDAGLLADLLPFVDVLLPNAAELAAMSRARSPDAAAAWALEGGVGCVVEKRGDAGAALWWRRGSATHGGYPVVALDTTGAGDSFDAGFLRAFLADMSPMDCLRLGNACGARASMALGGTGGFASLTEVTGFMAARGDDASAFAALERRS